MSTGGRKASILDRPLSKSKAEINVATFAFLFSEMVSYCEKRASTVSDLNGRLHALGYEVGTKILDVNYIREKGYKREINLQKMLTFIKTSIWRSLFGREADGLNQDQKDQNVYYILEKEPLVNNFFSMPKDRQNVQCTSFTAGIIEAFLIGSNYNAKVSAHYHNGTMYRIEFDDATLSKVG
ncbi:trafficking protein particle complex subunit 5-like [Watersipora subatra]|uniref:trafficking protein particle complex subunit 5-like n=1 Tax=Watersipora subatra TaxID=2589382 RepID=UPI00355B6B5D